MYKPKVFYASFVINTILLFVISKYSVAQIQYINISSGYGFGFASQSLGSNINYGVNETSNSIVKGSLGKGLITDIEFGHNWNDIISGELGISYLRGDKYTIKNVSINNFENNLIMNSNMLRLSPKIKFTYKREKTSYYLKLGIIYKLFSRIVIDTKQNDYLNNINIETERIFSGGNSFGLSSVIGFNKKLNNLISLYLEIENINQSWAPKKDIVSSYFVNEMDMKSSLTPYQKQTNYYRNFEVNNNNPSKSFYARDQLIQYFPFSSIGFKFGIQFNLKHN